MYEDRPAGITGLKLAILSLTRNCPGLTIHAWVPDASSQFLNWSRAIASLQVSTDRELIDGTGWNVKPSVILHDLANGHDQVLWCDSDIIITGDLEARLRSIPASSIVGTEEYYWGHHQGTNLRTEGLGLEVGRVIPATVNTGLLRVSADHADLIRAWRDVLASDQYIQVKNLPARDRPLHFWGDQEVLTGLLGSKTYSQIPLVQLRRGVDIAQCYGPSGFTVAERVRARSVLPLVIHAMGDKPWNVVPIPNGESFLASIRRTTENIHKDLTPYQSTAILYRDQLGEDTSWMEARTSFGAFSRSVGGRWPSLQELPLATLDSLQRRTRRALRIGQIGNG